MANKVTYEIEVDSKGAITSIKNLDNEVDKLNNSAKKTSGGLGGILGALKPSPMAIAGAAIAGIGVAFGYAAKKTMDFDKQMSAVKAVTNASDADMVKLRETALKLGSTTEFTATQAAQGLEVLGMAGFNTQQAIDALPGVLDLASAGAIDLARSADITANILSQFQKPASEATALADLMAKSVTTSNQNMEDFADAMAYLGPTAAAMKIPIEEVAAVIGTMANNGLKGSLGTRALGTSIVRLSKPTKAMAETMKELNLDFFDQQGQFVGMIGLTKELERATAGMTDEEKQRTLATLFGAEAIQEMNILLSTGSTKLQDYTNDLGIAEGYAKRMAETRLDNLAGDLVKLESATEGLAISLMESSQGGLRDMVQGLTNFISLLTTNKSVISESFAPFSEIDTSVISIFQGLSNIMAMFTGEQNGVISFFSLLNFVIEESLKPINALLIGIDYIVKGLQFVFESVTEIGRGFRAMGSEFMAFFGIESKQETKSTSSVQSQIDSGVFASTDPIQSVLDAVDEQLKPVSLNTSQNSLIDENTIDKKTKGANIDSNVNKVSGTTPTNVTLNINKLIESFSINSTNLTESTTKMRDMVAEVLLSAVNDVNLIAK
jgi:TP901 family phage tail tape measure protein